MLFGYPLQATRVNWLHACLGCALKTIHSAAQSGEVLPPWPGVIPAAHRHQLEMRHSLRDKLRAYMDAFSGLPEDDRATVTQAFRRQNNLRMLLDGRCNCATLNQLPAPIHEPLRDLSKCAFRLLTELEIRDQHYQMIYSTLGHKVCPFCGLHMLDAPEAPREDLDHYLPRSKYPFAAVNLRNLAPACHRCNSRYKGVIDILWDGATRRRAFFPYNNCTTTVSLQGTLPFGGLDEDKPAWTVSFRPHSEQVETWDSVYSVSARYVRDVLEKEYESWLGLFAAFCKAIRAVPTDAGTLIDVLKRSREYNDMEGYSNKGFLKAAVFEMLVVHCQQGNQRLIDLLGDVAEAAIPVPA